MTGLATYDGSNFGNDSTVNWRIVYVLVYWEQTFHGNTQSDIIPSSCSFSSNLEFTDQSNDFDFINGLQNVTLKYDLSVGYRNSACTSRAGTILKRMKPMEKVYSLYLTSHGAGRNLSIYGNVIPSISYNFKY